LVQTVIRPALAAGKLVVSNRFGLSTIAYQIYGRKRRYLLPFLEDVSKQVLGDLEPPHCILLDVSPTVGIERVRGRGDGMTRFDGEQRSFHERVRCGYLDHYNDNGRGVLINAARTLEEVQRSVRMALAAKMIIPEFAFIV
jgi:dTMP kinase